MKDPYVNSQYTTLDDRVSNEVINFSLDSPITFKTAVDKMITLFGDKAELLALGEALHGGEEIHTVNRIDSITYLIYIHRKFLCMCE